ncbi:uncharacterized protein LOC126742344 [Anthonomus grandis grandis]|uniref:uncharacterized protein LOC126742344 n=1 Tax=Anthonomus grandis grandis TaxID=2921223 RepID=UPI0021660B6D|nr:uncharacterized protein LOC126742344 [Anthonomus grandis grandis]
MAQVLTNNLLISSELVTENGVQVQQEEKVFSLEEVSWHDTRNDCWVVIYDRVYDITNFIEEHPGGSDILLEHAGRDGSIAFKGSGHSDHALRTLDKYFIGELPKNERIFRKSGGLFRLSGVPR